LKEALYISAVFAVCSVGLYLSVLMLEARRAHKDEMLRRHLPLDTDKRPRL
jgi:hypothetical protein